ncbi:MAG TPA: MarR family transcriptional regulator [Opitutaceae bacterium]|jgi:DNA-binding MarR family transcriptional regulator|nr:MarR family transcriptional regulator [Opitutaceae bacterium]
MPLLLLKDLPRYECLLEAAKKFPDLDPSACDVFLNLLRTGDEVFHVTESNYASHGLSQGRFGVLMLLKKRSASASEAAGTGEHCGPAGPLTPAELAAAAGVTRATMTGLIDTLERDGLVKRVRDANDRRMMSVNLTPKGWKLLDKILPIHFRGMAEIMSPLKESERKTLVRLLNKILQHASTLSPAQARRD